MISKFAKYRKLARYRLNQQFGYLLQVLSYKSCWPLCRPTQVVVNITERCNLRCRHCSAWRSDSSHQAELTTDEWMRMLRGLRRWAGTFQLVFSGGEPFLRSDICDLVRSCSDMGIVTTVVSNGTLLDRQRVAEIARCRLDNLVISLDGIKAETHDYIRGRDGTYKKVMAAIERVKELENGPSLTIAVMILRQNIDEIFDLVRMVKEKQLAAIIFQVMMQDFWGASQNPNEAWYVDHELWVEDTDKVCALFDRLIELRDSYPIANPGKQLQVMERYLCHPERSLQDQRCFVGVRNLFFNPNGDFSLCFQMGALGNVRTTHPFPAWRSMKAHYHRVAIRRCHKSCLLLNCNFPIIW